MFQERVVACARVTSGRREREREGERKREEERERDRRQVQSPECLFQICFKGRAKADKLDTDAGKGKEMRTNLQEGRGVDWGEGQRFG